jgi:signal transduction histidine kinase/ActR/RegA family two-component response regulator
VIRNHFESKFLSYLGLLIGFFAAYLSYEFFKEKSLKENKEFAGKVEHEYTKTLTLMEKLLLGINYFYNASQFVDRNEFGIYVNPLFKNMDFLEEVIWAKKLSRNSIKDFERKQRKFLPEFTIQPLEESFDYDYFITYRHSQLGERDDNLGQPFLGGQGRDYLKKKEKIRDIFSLRNNPESPDYATKVIGLPVYEKNSEGALTRETKGFLFATVRLDKLLASLEQAYRFRSGLSLVLFEKGGSRPIYGGLDSEAKYTFQKEVKVSGHTMVFIWQTSRIKLNLSVYFFIGLVFFFFFFIFMIVNLTVNRIKKNNAYIQKEIDEKTLELKEALSIKTRFLAMMGHEIRTPLNGILGCSELLYGNIEKEKNREYIKTIISSGESLKRILNNILDYSKIEAGKMNVNPTVTDLMTLLETSTHLFAPSARGQGVQLDLKTGNRPPLIEIDQDLVSQTINNLLSNAVKFARKKVEIELKTKELDEQSVLISVLIHDDGLGISQSQQSHLFEAFSQLKNSLTTTKGGTGLGLNVVQQIMTLMGGEVSFNSIENVGSTFSIQFKAKIAKVNHLVQSNKKQVDEISRKNEKMKILVVEDDSINQMVVGKMLEKLGYQFDLASNGLEALEQYKLKQYNLVLMDNHMPLMDGLEATKQIRKYETEQGLGSSIIIAFTASTTEQDKDLYEKAGMDDFLGKPLNFKRLEECLDLYREIFLKNQPKSA